MLTLSQAAQSADAKNKGKTFEKMFCLYALVRLFVHNLHKCLILKRNCGVGGT